MPAETKIKLIPSTASQIRANLGVESRQQVFEDLLMDWAQRVEPVPSARECGEWLRRWNEAVD